MAGVENFAIPSDEENEDVVVQGDEGPVFLTVKRKKKKKKGYDVPSRYITYSEADELGKLEALRQTEADLGYRRTMVVSAPGTCEKLRRSIDDLMNKPSSSPPAMLITIFIMIVIVVSTILFIVQSWPTFQTGSTNRTFWFLSETVIIAIFTIEYCIRLVVSKDPAKFVVEPLNIVDLVAILPYFIELIFLVAGIDNNTISGLLVLRVIRIARVFRVFKLGRYSEVFQIVIVAFTKSLDAMLLLVFFLVIGLILFSSLMYFAEQTQEEFDEDLGCWVYTDNSLSPGEVSPYQSIPHTIWWCIVTMTTVGYGDTFPITPLGKAVAGVTMLCGLLLLAFPVGVLGAKFSEQYENEQANIARRRLRAAMSDNTSLDRLMALRTSMVGMRRVLNRLKPKVNEMEDRYKAALATCEKLENEFPDAASYIRRSEG